MARTPSAEVRPLRSSAAEPVVRQLRVDRSDAELVAGLRDGEAWARAALFDRHAPAVTRVLRRLLGPEAEGDLPDLIHDVFVQALCSLDGLREGAALSGWMRTIAARTAYRAIRNRRAKQWLRFWEPSAVPEISVADVDPEVIEACRRTYAVLDRMPTKERLAFVLRHVEKLELREVAEACGVSLATIKRRLARAQQRFARLAERDPLLKNWLREGNQWSR